MYSAVPAIPKQPTPHHGKPTQTKQQPYIQPNHSRFLRVTHASVAAGQTTAFRSRGVLHGESSKRLATPRNTKDKKHLQSTQSAQPANRTDQAPRGVMRPLCPAMLAQTIPCLVSQYVTGMCAHVQPPCAHMCKRLARHAQGMRSRTPARGCARENLSAITI